MNGRSTSRARELLLRRRGKRVKRTRRDMQLVRGAFGMPPVSSRERRSATRSCPVRAGPTTSLAARASPGERTCSVRNPAVSILATKVPAPHGKPAAWLSCVPSGRVAAASEAERSDRRGSSPPRPEQQGLAATLHSGKSRSLGPDRRYRPDCRSYGKRRCASRAPSRVLLVPEGTAFALPGGVSLLL